jgi:hypothetical protein
LDYVEFTAAVAIAATSVATANVIVTGSSVAYDGATAVLVTFYCPRIDAPNSTAPHLLIGLFEDGTQLGCIADITSPAAVSWSTACHVTRRLTPSAASHVYSVRGYGSAAIVGCQAVAGAGGAASANLMPGFIRIARAA